MGSRQEPADLCKEEPTHGAGFLEGPTLDHTVLGGLHPMKNSAVCAELLPVG